MSVFCLCAHLCFLELRKVEAKPFSVNLAAAFLTFYLVGFKSILEQKNSELHTNFTLSPDVQPLPFQLPCAAGSFIAILQQNGAEL